MKKIAWGDILIFLVAGQLMSTCLFGTGVIGDILTTDNGLNIPSLLMFMVYFLVLIISTPIFICNHGRKFFEVFKKCGWKYIFISIIDFEVSYIIIKAFEFTNYASIQLIDTLTIPFSIFLSICILKTKFYPLHYVGGAIATVGVVALILSDLNGKFDEFSKGKNILIGNLMCVASAFLYSVSNVVSELIMKDGDIYEWLFFMGLYGSIFASVQCLILERTILSTFAFNQEIILFITIFVVILTIFYMLLPLFIEKFGSAPLNLSLVTTDLFAIGYAASKTNYFTTYHIISVVLIIGGIIIFQGQSIYLSQKTGTVTINEGHGFNREENNVQNQN